MELFLVLLLLAAGGVLSAFLTDAVAKSKGHNWESWAAVGFWFGPFGLLAAVGLGDVKTQRLLQLLADPEGKHVDLVSVSARDVKPLTPGDVKAINRKFK
jgi:hypothetical protein